MIRDFYSQSSIYDHCRRLRRVAPQRSVTKQFKKNPCPPCLGEALMRGSIVYITIFMVWSEPPRFIPVSTELNFYRTEFKVFF